MIRYRLACDHIVKPCSTGSRHWCEMCGDLRDVVERLEFSARCESCRYLTYHGYARIIAELAADKHVRRRPGHVVQIWEGSKNVSKIESRSVGDSTAEPLF